MHGRRPIIFYTNGYETYMWDDAQYPPRRVLGFYTRDDLRRLIRQRDERKPLGGITIKQEIVERYYQTEAIRRVGEAFEENARRTLLVMATGTGKTRTAIALVDVLQRAGWVKRVLFLADRTALVRQAKNAFSTHLPDVSVAAYTSGMEVGATRVVVATYPSILNAIDDTRGGTREFSVGEFDLVIIDEAHRSIYHKFGAIFDYFDALIVGLTATPKNEVEHNTYHFFELEADIPTYAYELGQAVNDGFLVPYRNLSVPIKFQQQGIKYDALSEEDKEEYEDKFYDDETEDFPDFIESNQLNQWVFNEDTVDKILQTLMEEGLTVAGGDRIGKTIIFARNHRHAEFIAERFDFLYPDRMGGFLSVIDNYINYAQDLIDRFSEKEKEPVIAVSVDMLDTGIDVPEILNLVFFKIVRSRVKFWQMIGRGTRLCPELLAPDADKEHFLILDFCENFEYFGENPAGYLPQSQVSLSERIFNRRLTLSELLRHADYQDAENIALRTQLLDTLHTDTERIRDMRGETIAVRTHRRYVDTYVQRSRWDALTQTDVQDIRDHIAILTFAEDKDEIARRFDVLCLNLAISIIESTPRQKRDMQQVIQIGNYLYEHSMNIPTVAKKKGTIEQIREPEFWQSVTTPQIQKIREDLRELVRFIESGERRMIVQTDLTDQILGVGEGPDITDGAFNTTLYCQRVQKYVRDNQDQLVIQKLRFNEPITTRDLKQLEGLLLDAEFDPEVVADAFGTSEPLSVLVRSIVGLDVNAAKAVFAEFLAARTFGADQIQFVNQIINNLVTDGVVDPGRLFEVPYTDIHFEGLTGVFPEGDALQIRDLLFEVRHRAVVV